MFMPRAFSVDETFFIVSLVGRTFLVCFELWPKECVLLLALYESHQCKIGIFPAKWVDWLKLKCQLHSQSGCCRLATLKMATNISIFFCYASIIR